MTASALMGSRPWLVAGWTMLHFAWIGAALGLIAAAGRRAVRSARPELRHGVALAALATLAVAPGPIAWHVAASLPTERGHLRHLGPDRGTVWRPDLPQVEDRIPPEIRPGPDGATPALRRDAATPVWIRARPGGPGRLLERTAAALPWAWLVGAPLTFALTAAGLIGAERLRRSSRPLEAGALPEMCHRLAATLGLARRVGLGICDRLAAPVVVGILRPMILLPPAALTGWGPELLEMVLLHELAHVRRLDTLVNLLQRLVESALFFHPAVWWASAWVRLEREHCCDRLVVSRTGRPRAYASALAALAALELVPPGRAALAMADAPLVARIRQILAPEDHAMKLPRSLVGLAAALLAAPALLIASQARPDDRDEPPKSPAPAAPEAPRQDEHLQEIFRRARHGAEMFDNVQRRAYALSHLAAVQAGVGDREAARQTFRDAIALVEGVGIDDSYGGYILTSVARSQAKAGFRDEARETLRRALAIAEGPAEKAIAKYEMFQHILEQQVELDDREGARETLRRARAFLLTDQDPFIQLFGRQWLANLLARSGDVDEALRIAEEPEAFTGPDAERRRRREIFGLLLSNIESADRDAAEARLARAIRLMDEPSSGSKVQSFKSRNFELTSIAVAQARLGKFDEALRTARSIEAEAAPEGLPEARRSEFLDGQKSSKSEAFQTIAEAQSKAGDAAGARATAEESFRIIRTAEALGVKSFGMSRAAEILARAGDLAGARRIAEEFPPEQRVGVLETIARARREAGDEEAARGILRDALDLAQRRLDDVPAGFEDPVNRRRNDARAVVARLQAALGRAGEAIRTARAINDGGAKNTSLRQVAATLARAGDVADSLDAVDAISGPKAQAEALEDVAGAVPRREEGREPPGS